VKCRSRFVNGERGLGLRRQIAIEMVLVAAIGLALAALGPFGSYALPFGERAALWIGFILAGYGIFRPMLIAAAWLSEAAAIGSFAARLVTLALAAVPFSILVRFILERLVPAANAPFHETYLQVCGVGLVVMLVMKRLVGGAGARPEPQEFLTAPPADAVPQRARFLARLPPHVGPRLLCLSMEDHYVRAHGPEGSALILMRLRDAIDELDGMAGLQVHRSWWVASDAVQRVERDGERMWLRLVNGLAAPVARSQVGAVRAQRWPQA
jgi:hypothetical protein